MFTDSNSTPARFLLQENEPIVKGFPCATELKPGTPVKLANTGIVSAIAAVTDSPIGIVTSGYSGNDPGTVRVLTPFSAIIRAKSDGTTAIAGHVACSGLDTDGNPKYKAAVSTNWVTGIVLEGGDDTEDILVGILRNPYKL